MSLEVDDEQLKDPDFLFRFGIALLLLLLLWLPWLLCFSVAFVIALSHKDMERPWSSCLARWKV